MKKGPGEGFYVAEGMWFWSLKKPWKVENLSTIIGKD